jgi:hypothetical protein
MRQLTELTTSFVTSEVMNIQGANQVQLLISFTKGDSAGCRLKIEYSENKSDWYQESAIDEFPSLYDMKHILITRIIEETGNYVISIPVSASYFRVSSQAITSGVDTLLGIVATAASI